MRTKILLAATASAVLSLNCPFLGDGLLLRDACAQDEDPEVVKMAKQHYKLGLDAYNAGKYDLAIKELKKAYLLKRLPPILLNIGLTYRKMNDYDMATYFYKKFLNEAPADDKQRPAAEAALKEIEEEKAQTAKAAQQQAAKPAVEAAPKGKDPAKAAATPSATGESPAAPTTEWSHTPLDAVPPGQAIDVRVQMPVMKGVKVKVFFRKEGQAAFDSLELKRRGNEKVARLPASVAEGKTFQYYIEARDPAGAILKSSGSEASPNIVLIDASARPQVAGAEVPEGEDEESKKPKKGFSRDIENEAVTFDPKEIERRKAMERLRGSLNQDDKPKKQIFGTLGWTGIGLMAGGVVVGGLGATFYALARGRADAVNADSTCNGPDHQIKVGGIAQCPHFGPNPDASMSRALPKPTSSDYEAEGRTFFNVSQMWYAAPALVAGGAALVIVDVVKRKQAEAKANPPKKGSGKKKKVKKVVEVEEEAFNWNVAPVINANEVGVVGGFRF